MSSGSDETEESIHNSLIDVDLSATRAAFAPHRKRDWVYLFTTVLGAFLLFAVEPLIAKLILPTFGGGAGVWSVCLMLFQITLLLGYLYAHLLTRYCSPLAQSVVHGVIALLSLFSLPPIPLQMPSDAAVHTPSVSILLVLAHTVGLPFLVLSSTGPLLQAWYSGLVKEYAPYRLYAFSNVASLAALLAYPFLVEPLVSNHHQALAWSFGYSCFVACGVAISYSRKGTLRASSVVRNRIELPQMVRLTWVFLAFCASSLLVAITGYISQNIAAVPFLWVLPLSLYLLTFIVCFGSVNWYNRRLTLRAFALSLACMAYVLGDTHHTLPPAAIVAIFCFGLFACCLICNGELAALKPPSAQLTSFYLYMASGAAVGSLFVAILAPHVFNGFYELPISLGICGLVIRLVVKREASIPPSARRKATYQLVSSALIIVLLVSLYLTTKHQQMQFRQSQRNFYGVLRIRDVPGPPIVLLQNGAQVSFPGGPGYRELINGTIEHGVQFLSIKRRNEPTTYYGRKSGVAAALTAAGTRGPLSVGIIGLGAGTLATYGRPRDHYTFFEINPLVIRLAKNEFTFLRDSQAEVNIVEGDARLSLEHAPASRFDVLVVDAFSSDAIPIHLLTREAFELYVAHLNTSGVLAVHVSNKYLDLVPVVLAAARDRKLYACVVENSRDAGHAVYPATWVILSKDESLLTGSEFAPYSIAQRAFKPSSGGIWTDDYSSLLRTFRW